MKSAMAQILEIPADIAGNLSKISGMAAQGPRQKCRLNLFPELVDLL
jgi:predicted amidohydrolase